MKIVGVGIFRPYPASRRDFKYGHKYVLQNSSGAEITASQVYEENVVCPPDEEIIDNVIQFKFVALAGGVRVEAGQKFIHAGWIAYNDGHNRCFYSESGDRPADVEGNPDPNLFEVSDSSLSSNSTRLNRGIVPGFLYHLV